jgi:hypothetical protein
MGTPISPSAKRKMSTAAKAIAGATRGSVMRASTLGHPLTSLPAFSSSGLTFRRKAIVRSIATGVKAEASTNVQPKSPKNAEAISRDQVSGKMPPRSPVRPTMDNQATART